MKVYSGLTGCYCRVERAPGVSTAILFSQRRCELTTAGRKGEREDHPSRDTWVASVYWEEWENGVKEHIDALMARKQ